MSRHNPVRRNQDEQQHNRFSKQHRARNRGGASLLEIMKAMGSQPHTLRGSVSILGSKGERKSSRPRTLRVNGRTRSANSSGNSLSKRRLRRACGRRSCFWARVSDVTDPSHQNFVRFRSVFVPRLLTESCRKGSISARVLNSRVIVCRINE